MIKRSLIAICLLFLLFPSVVQASCDTPPSPGATAQELQDYVAACQQKITESQAQQQTLKSAITTINSKINLVQGQINITEFQIKTLEREIGLLNTLLGQLGQSLEQLKTVFVARVRNIYMHRNINFLNLFFSSNSFSDFFTRWRFINIVRIRDQIVLTELSDAKTNYDVQKSTKEEKQKQISALKAQLQGQKQVLAVQQLDKQNLLKLTQNDEKKYQDLLAKAKAELAAIEAIIAGSGKEVEVKDVSVGDKIASVIPGASACSSGAHLHFEVVKNQIDQNPASFLKNISNIIWSNSPDSSFNFTGSWNWPLSEPIRITQGYGNTAYSSRYANHFHTGIDMVSASPEVHSVAEGKYYQGSIACGGGTLKYVHVKHKNDGYDTYYLHVNYF